MLSLIVLVFVLIDLIILISYTVAVGVIYDDGLDAKNIINSENPEDVEGVSKKCIIKSAISISGEHR